MHLYCLISFATTCYLSPYTLDNILAGKGRVTTILYEHTSVYILSESEPMVVTTLTGRLITLYPSTSYLSSDECAL